jgi:hypothetical protein
MLQQKDLINTCYSFTLPRSLSLGIIKPLFLTGCPLGSKILSKVFSHISLCHEYTFLRNVFLFIYLCIADIETWTLHIVGKYSTSELHTQSLVFMTGFHYVLHVAHRLAVYQRLVSNSPSAVRLQ